MVHRLIIAGLVLSISVGCSTSRVIRLDTGSAAPLEYRPSTSGKSVHVAEHDFEEALARLVLELPLDIRQPGKEWLVLASSTSSVEARESPNFVRRVFESLCVGDLSRGQCLSLLGDVVIALGVREKLAVALAFSLEPMRESTAEAVKETLSPRFFYAVIVSSMVTWAVMAANPEPVFTKGAAVVTALMLIYLGVDTVLDMVKASFALLQAARKASTLAELEDAGERFGRVLGEQGARLFILALTAVASRGTLGASSWMASRLPLLPSVAQAQAVGSSQVGVLLRAVEQVSAVAISAEGTITITLGSGAVASLARITGSDGSSGDDAGEDVGSLKDHYKGVTRAPGYPPNFKSIQNGTVKVPVKDKALLQKLRKIEPGTWNKVYKDGWVGSDKVSLHYFESPSGGVFAFKVIPDWSNL